MSAITIHSSLAAVIDQCPGASHLLMQLGIDPSRHRDQTLEQACETCGVDPRIFLDAALCAPCHRESDPRTDWSRAPLDDLVDHIVATHHAYLRRTLSVVRLLIEKAAHDRGADYAALPRVRQIIDKLTPEVLDHLNMEEQVLFPKIRELARASRLPAAPAERVDRAMQEIGHEYEEAAKQLQSLRNATDRFTSPPDAPTAYQALMEELADIEFDLERHSYLENDVLVPRARDLEQQVTGAEP